ncbi:MAG: signal peptidase I [Clostridia bacterium]|nr:signal peptidase I [Clostridia bacterium]
MKKEQTTVSHKILTVIGIIMCIVLIPMLITNVTLIVKSYVNPDKVPDVGGYMPMIVLTESMQGTINAGDLIVIKTAKPEDIEKGDIITYFDPKSSKNSTTTHTVIDIKTEDGKLMFETKGDANNAADTEPIPADKLVGEYTGIRIPGMGKVAMFMQTVPGLIVCVVLPLLLLVGYDVIRRRKFEKAKQTDTDALLAELEALKAMAAEKTDAQTEAPAEQTEVLAEQTEAPAEPVSSKAEE